MKPKAKITPTVKLKQFHWTKIANTKIEGTMWHSLSDDKVELNLSEIQTKFAAAASKKKDEDKKAAEEEKKKSELVKLIDDKRSYNIDLSLARF